MSTKETASDAERDTMLANEETILSGMMKAAAYKEDGSLDNEIHISRKGVDLFSFHIRPLSEETLYKCRKKATPQLPNPAGKQFPPIEGETNLPKLLAYKIYFATTPEYRKLTWDNPEMRKAANAVEPTQVVEFCLLAGEINRIDDIIDEISGFSTTKDDYLKNSSAQEENSI